MWRLVSNLIFPNKCLVCKKSGDSICSECFLTLKQEKKEKENIFYIYNYKNEYVQELLHRLKYYHDHSSLDKFGLAIANFILERFVNRETKEIFITYIPLTEKDKRLHCHSELLAREVCKILQSKGYTAFLVDLFVKTNIKKQAHTADRRERLSNISGKIILKNKNFSYLENKLLIIIDDVFTTGSTLKVAREALLHVSGCQIVSLCVAH